MAYDPVERLRVGNVDFLLDGGFTTYDTESLIKRIRGLSDKNEIIKAFLPKLIKYQYFFCFEIIYDMDEFESETKKLLSSKHKEYFKFNTEKIDNLINKTSWGEKYIFQNIDNIFIEDETNRMNIIITFIYEKSNMSKKWINLFLKNKDMHKRALFLKSLIKLYSKEASIVLKNFEDILEYKPGVGEQMMLFPPKIDDRDLSEIVIECLNSSVDRIIFENLKNYLLKNYSKNDVAEKLLSPKQVEDRNLGESIFKENADELFLTSRRQQYLILTHYSELISKQIMKEYKNILRLDQAIKKSNKYYRSPFYEIYAHELGEHLKQVVDKYLSLSKKDRISYLMQGSMSSSFKIGDFVLKIGRGKWSYEDVICPNVYLILKNLEEYFVRDKDGIVVANLEVQPYLGRKSTNLSDDYFHQFHKDLRDLGYYTDELRSRESFGDNFGLLNSYKDADCKDPEKLPEHFKKMPLVLYDRDRVFKVGKPAKVLRESWSD